MCEYIQAFDTNTKFVILMHPKEFKKVKNNTGRFTHLSLKNSELFVGIDFSQNKKINEIVATHDSYILYPSEDALNLTDTKPTLSSNKKLAIFLIDSTWSCAKKMFIQSENLQILKHMSFSTTQTSKYEIKEQPNERYLSTIESTLVVLEELNKWGIEELKKESLQNFLNPFLEMVAYQKKLIINSKHDSVRFKKYSFM